jgi:microcin C transport system substrate-binding protein
MNRRSLLISALIAPTALGGEWHFGLTASAAVEPARPKSGPWRYGISKFGHLKYAADFKKFNYANVDAPKGGVVRQGLLGTYDNFNPVVADIKGALADNIDLMYDTLLLPALDEITSQYGLVAEAVGFPEDFSLVTFRLRTEAKWHDGAPITPKDAIFSYDAWKKYSPQMAANFRHVAKAEQTSEREVTFTFDAPGNRELPLALGRLSILPEHWWKGTNKDGKNRNIGETTLEPPLGSGPYRIDKFSPGGDIFYERVKDYWGRDLNVNQGRNNFGTIRMEYFRDATVAIEALTSDNIDWRIENSAKNWASAYQCPAVDEKRVLLEEFPINNVGIMQAFAFNTRRDKFKDPQVRRAFNYAFDFEVLNKEIFFGQYTRIASYFQGTDLAANGLPAGRELKFLQDVGDKVPGAVFTTPYANPVGGNQEAERNNLRQAMRLLNQAGYEVHNQQLVNSRTSEPFAIELLGNNTLFERIFLFYKASLERLGIAVTISTVEDAEYENRLRSWDFDIITYAWGETLSPGNELRGYWGSAAAGQPGSENLIGIKNHAIDILIERVISAGSRDDLVAAARALDRVLLWNEYVVPQWSFNRERVAHWDRFSRPDPLPKYGIAGFPALWWWDAAKAGRTASR